jgi:predicted DNA-binding transcriptional regulator AlpA
VDTIHPSTTGRRASSIPEFCDRHRISRAFFYKLKAQGLAPRITALGSRRLIFEEDEVAWRAVMAAQSAA